MKKNTHKKIPKKVKHQKAKSYKKHFLIITIVLISILLGLIVGSFYGTQIDEAAKDIKTIVIDDIKEFDENKEDKQITFEEKTRALEVEYVDNTNTNIYIEEPKKEKKIFHFEEPNLEEIDKEDEKEKEEEPLIITPPSKKIEEKEIIHKISNRPKLAIIIDDMTTKKQIKSVQELGFVVNMAFLPPTKGHPKSAKITKNLNKYMIHLPLQASSFKYEEENTLHINDDIAVIENRIKKLKVLYPGTKFLNNHTGSKFTSNQIAMDKLFHILKKYDYTFIDSRTTAKSVAKKSSQKYGVKMFSRNIFLDNKKEKKYIQNQLKKAIKIAKKKGMAIAIGHPYRITFQTLKDSKNLLKDLDLVFVQEL